MPTTDGIDDARRHRKALATSLGHWRAVREVDEVTGRVTVVAAQLVTGEGAGTVVEVDGRSVPWDLDLEAEASRLGGCEHAACLSFDPAAGVWRAVAIGCRSRLCPVCARRRASRQRSRWEAVLTAAADDGAELRHWTLTQPVVAAPGGVVTGPEARRGWVGTVADDARGAAHVRAVLDEDGSLDLPRPVGGEGLGAAYRRLRAALDGIRHNRRDGGRERWRSLLGGYLLGLEWTGGGAVLACGGCGWTGSDAEADRGGWCPSCGIRCGRSRSRYPRWHVHAHILGVSRAATDTGEVEVLRRDWARLVGGSIRAQHSRVVDPSAVVEVLKYPFKPAHLTSAQRVEVLSYIRGLHPQTPGGALHHSSRAASEEPWSAWHGARVVLQPHERLYYVQDRAVGTNEERRPPVLWTGYPGTGRHLWAVRRAGAWVTWEEDAERYVAVLRHLDPSAEVPEPGSDEDDDD